MSGTNFPTILRSFIGRKREIADIQALLKSARLLTLTGAAGCGKTRLALQVSQEVGGQYKDGIYWVDLAQLTDSRLVPAAVWTATRLEYEKYLELARLRLTELEFQAEQATEFAQHLPLKASRESWKMPDELTGREREIAILLDSGANEIETGNCCRDGGCGSIYPTSVRLDLTFST